MIDISPVQKQKLEIFKQKLIEKNKHINLISRKQAGFIDKIFEENIHSSLLMKEALEDYKEEVLDLGSGGGLPGLICAILYSKTQFILCEKNRKKAECLKSFIFDLEIKNVSVLAISAEKSGKQFDLILSQATGSLEDLISVLEQIASPKACLYLWKNNIETKVWDNSPFQVEIFKKYQSLIDGAAKVILKAGFKDCSTGNN